MIDAMSKTIFGNHLRFWRHFELFEKVYFYKSFVIAKERDWKKNVLKKVLVCRKQLWATILDFILNLKQFFYFSLYLSDANA
jgi:hypothetical protein